MADRRERTERRGTLPSTEEGTLETQRQRERFPEGKDTRSDEEIMAEQLRALGEQLEVPEVDIEEVIAAAQQLGAQNIRRLPGISQTAEDITLRTAESLDVFQRERFFEGIEDILPGFRERIIGTSADILERVSGITEEFLSGEIPQDVQDVIRQQRAELGISRGVRGEIAQFATARDLGLTSLELVERGVEFATGAVSPLTQTLLSQTLALQPPTTDVQSLFERTQDLAADIALPSATALLSSSTQIATTNAETLWAKELSLLNLELDLFQTEMQTKLERETRRAEEKADLLAFAGGILGIGSSLFGRRK